ncbi:IS5/IS1182 family transposase, partial [Bacteroides fragilis]|nr:IS5/IS1182 family transposase [Bacteroides fragilis]
GKDYKTDKGRKLSFMRGIFISCWINHKKRKKLEGTLFGHPLLMIRNSSFKCKRLVLCIL